MAGASFRQDNELHFHIRGICTNCGHVELYRTPLPQVLIAGDLCLRCGAPDIRGLDDDTDEACIRCETAYAHRIWERYLRGEGDPAEPR